MADEIYKCKAEIVKKKKTKPKKNMTKGEKLEELAERDLKEILRVAKNFQEVDPELTPVEVMTRALMQVSKKRSKALDVMKSKKTDVSREKLRKLVQVVYDYQDLRIRTSNRLAKKADGTAQDKDDAILPEEEIPQIRKVLDDSRIMEDEIFATIKAEVEKFPVYNLFLSKVKGCGPAMSAIIISCININIATTAGKIIQYSGLNSGMVKGKKKDEDGNIITTDELVRGDKPTKGFLLPYNAFLKSKLMGVLAPCMLKSNSQYRVYYDNMKERLSHSDNPVNGDPNRKWKNESKGHIDMAAKRYMIKIFLQDLYSAWRQIENLPFRKSYQEEYLGHVSTMERIGEKIWKDAI
jgi:hypothetical protein